MSVTSETAGSSRPFTILTDAVIVGEDGRHDLLVAGGKLVAIGDNLRSLVSSEMLAIHDLSGLTVAPGLVDAHAHLLGGGGGDGFDTRVPELVLTDLSLAGITTVVGAPGIDMVSRNMEGHVAKARGLDTEGITARIYVGGMHRPLRTLSGAAWRDVYLIPDVVGLKVAVGEPRAPAFVAGELVNLTRELAWVERASQRGAVLHIHLGLDPEGPSMLSELLRNCPDPTRVVVTHCNYSETTLEAAVELASLGVRLDITTMMSPARGLLGTVPPADAAMRLMDEGVAPEQISMSTDANGTVPNSAGGTWEPYRTNTDSLLESVRELARTKPIEAALALATANPAAALRMNGKGIVAVGADADLLVLDSELHLVHVYARGRRLVMDGQAVVRGRFENKESARPAP